MLNGLLILLIIFDLLDDVGVLEEAQKDLLRHLAGTEWLNFCKTKEDMTSSSCSYGFFSQLKLLPQSHSKPRLKVILHFQVSKLHKIY